MEKMSGSAKRAALRENCQISDAKSLCVRAGLCVDIDVDLDSSASPAGSPSASRLRPIPKDRLKRLKWVTTHCAGDEQRLPQAPPADRRRPR